MHSGHVDVLLSERSLGQTSVGISSFLLLSGDSNALRLKLLSFLPTDASDKLQRPSKQFCVHSAQYSHVCIDSCVGNVL